MTITLAATANVAFGYDAAGNRTSMTDGLGSVTYQVDALSRIQSETRTFTGVGSYQLQYEYNFANEVTSVTDPFGAKVMYQHDQMGQLTGVTGTGFADVSTYASAIQYRAWGGLKGMTLGGNNAVSLTYDQRLQVETYNISYPVTGGTYTQGAQFWYYPDGKVKYSSELINTMQDRSYSYDQAGRLTQVLTGGEARGEANPNQDAVPFRDNYQYDVWGNQTSRIGRYWGHDDPSFSATYVNSQNPSWQYDAAGNVLQDTTRHYSYDAAGRNTSVTEPPRQTGGASITTTQAYDGDGRRIKVTNNGAVTYELRSAVMGGDVITTINGQGQRIQGYVYANGQLIANQAQSGNIVLWYYQKPDGSGRWESMGSSNAGADLELDGMGNDVGIDNPYLNVEESSGEGRSYPGYGSPTDLTAGCALDGQAVPCEIIGKWVGRNQEVFLFDVINRRFGGFTRNDDQKTVPGGTLPGDSGAHQDPRDGRWDAYVNVPAGPDTFETTIGYSFTYVNFQPISSSIYSISQNPGNGTKYLNRGHHQMAAEAIRKAEELLGANPDCAAYLKGAFGLDPLKNLRQITFLNGFREVGSDLASSIADELQGPLVGWTWAEPGYGNSMIYLSGSFYTSSVGGITDLFHGYSASVAASLARALVVLHELKHANGAVHLTQAQSDEWDKNIYEKCFAAPMPNNMAE